LEAKLQERHTDQNGTLNRNVTAIVAGILMNYMNMNCKQPDFVQRHTHRAATTNSNHASVGSLRAQIT
jgi:hypothetical protein